MIDDVDSLACSQHGVAISNVAANDFDAEGFEIGVTTASEAAHPIAARKEVLDDVSSQKSAAAGDKDFHGLVTCSARSTLVRQRPPIARD